MYLAVPLALALALLALAGQVWVQVDWVGGLSEHCDYPEGCLGSWLPFAFRVTTVLWLTSLVAGAVAWLLAAGQHGSRAAVSRLGTAWAAGLMAFFFTPASLPRRHGVIDGRAFEDWVWAEHRHLIAVALLVLAAAGYGWELSGVIRAGRSDPPRAVSPPRRSHVLAVVCLLAGATVGLGYVYAERQEVATRVEVTPTERARYLDHAKHGLDGHPERPRSGRVSDESLVGEGTRACTWLAGRPVRDEALGLEAAQLAYLAAYPRVAGDWQLRQGRTPLRRWLVVNAWQLLCDDVYADHVSFAVARGD